jgi:hypothetical protein
VGARDSRLFNANLQKIFSVKVMAESGNVEGSPLNTLRLVGGCFDSIWVREYGTPGVPSVDEERNGRLERKSHRGNNWLSRGGGIAFNLYPQHSLYALLPFGNSQNLRWTVMLTGRSTILAGGQENPFMGPSFARPTRLAL